MKCESCPYSEKVHGVVNYFRCTQRGGARNGHDGCQLVEQIKAGNRANVNSLIKGLTYQFATDESNGLPPIGVQHGCIPVFQV